MNILNEFTLKNIRLNRKRTIVTIIGIILSTALICCVTGMFTSFSKTMVNSIIDQEGDYHVEVVGISKYDLNKFKNNNKIDEIYLENYLGNTSESNIGYYNIMAISNNSFTRFSLYKGNFPTNSNQILVSYYLKDYLGKDLTLTLDDLQTKTYSVVGVLEEKYWLNSIYTMLDDNYEFVNLKVKYKNIRDTYKVSKDIFNGYSLNYNKDLLNWSFVIKNDTYMNTFIYLVLIVLGIIVVSSVFVIRNSFEISITEKMQQYGMLASIGATKKQIRKSVLFEGFILGIIGIPLGILLGYIVIHLLILFSNVILDDIIANNLKFVVNIPIFAIILSVLFGIITIIFSSLKSAYKAGKVSPIVAIRSNNEIKIKSKKLKTPRIINKLFGIGGIVAYKNLKRSKKKYRTTVISLVVSISIFISLYSFMDNIFSASKFVYKNMYFNMTVNVYNNFDFLDLDLNDYSTTDELATYKQQINELIKKNNQKTKESFNQIIKIDGVKDYMIERVAYFYLKEYSKDIAVYAFGDNIYRKILKELNLNYENAKDKIIFIENMYNRELNKIAKLYDFKDNEEITLSTVDNTYNLKVVKSAKLDKYDIQNFNYDYGVFVVSDDLFNEISNELHPGMLYLKVKNADKVEKSIKAISEDGFEIINYEREARIMNNIVLWISVFLYGFIIVISLIGVTNIFNTITTNMNLRSKEFAMLKSVGMTKKEFNRMIRLESIMYGLKSLLIGCIIGIILSYLIYMALSNSLDIGYKLPITAIIISIIFITLVVGLIMKYSLSKINKQNIIETIRKNNI